MSNTEQEPDIVEGEEEEGEEQEETIQNDSAIAKSDKREVEGEEQEGEVEGEDVEGEEQEKTVVEGEDQKDQTPNTEQSAQIDTTTTHPDTEQDQTKATSTPVEKKTESVFDPLAGLSRSLGLSLGLSESKKHDRSSSVKSSLFKMLTPGILSSDVPQDTVVTSQRLKDLKEVNDDSKRLVQLKYTNMLKGINQQIVGLNQPLTRTLGVAQDISYNIRTLNENLHTLTTRITEMDNGSPLLSIQ
ncbi:hypothetical protein AKO1_008855 [Acrasis kona]|uniref:Biogenesis of lysosome-related organelles complex 1 subunit 3 n=1 Tax=Acrasis kona TaxID=1008807 RepID=A0AAW2ZDI2_9EUKA